MLHIKQQKGCALCYPLAHVPLALVTAAQAESQRPHGDVLLSTACPAHLPPTVYLKSHILKTPPQLNLERAVLHKLGHKVGEKPGYCTVHP